MACLRLNNKIPVQQRGLHEGARGGYPHRHPWAAFGVLGTHPSVALRGPGDRGAGVLVSCGSQPACCGTSTQGRVELSAGLAAGRRKRKHGHSFIFQKRRITGNRHCLSLFFDVCLCFFIILHCLGKVLGCLVVQFLGIWAFWVFAHDCAQINKSLVTGPTTSG